mmetsp:Transcript_70605/g.204717  ORF Transcript_70605/g.204717 Transcript_70605/m.204717 type:complete len:681 (-) Transcript_70605:634-2676(-)
MRAGKREAVIQAVADVAHVYGAALARGHKLRRLLPPAGANHGLLLGLWQQAGAPVREAYLGGHGLDLRALVAGQHDRHHAQVLELRDGLAGVASHSIGEQQHAGEDLVHGDENHRPFGGPGCRQGFDLAVEADTLAGQEVGVADADPVPVDGPHDAAAPVPLEVSHLRERAGGCEVGHAARVRLHDGLRQWMAVLALHACGPSQELLLRPMSKRLHPDEAEVPCRDGAGLVEDHGMELRRSLQGRGALYEAAALRPDAGGHHHGHRCRQAHGARASDHHHRHAEFHREQDLGQQLDVAAVGEHLLDGLRMFRPHHAHLVKLRDAHETAQDQDEPHEESAAREGDDAGHKNPRHPVGGALDLRLARLRRLHKRHHLAEHRLAPDLSHSQKAPAGDASGAAQHLFAALLQDWRALAREQALVHVHRRVRAHPPIHGDLRPGEDPEDVVDLHELYGDLVRGDGAPGARLVAAERGDGWHARRQVGQGPNGRQLRLSLHALAEEHDGDEDRPHGQEVVRSSGEVARTSRVACHKAEGNQGQRVEIGGVCRHADQDIHVRRLALEGLIGGGVKAPADQKMDWSRQPQNHQRQDGDAVVHRPGQEAEFAHPATGDRKKDRQPEPDEGQRTGKDKVSAQALQSLGVARELLVLQVRFDELDIVDVVELCLELAEKLARTHHADIVRD